MNECIPVEELGTLDRLPENDPRRRHAATCPRCSSMIFVYEEFLRARAVEGADVHAADERLSDFIAARVEGASPKTARDTAPAGTRRFRFSLAGAAMAAAAVMVATVAIVRWQPWSPQEIVLRGPSAERFTGLRAEATTAGGFELHWNAVASADAYRVVVLSGDLGEVARLAPTSELSARFEPESESVRAAARYWQVTALVEGGEILTCDPQRLP